jgi:hypothetical protein
MPFSLAADGHGSNDEYPTFHAIGLQSAGQDGIDRSFCPVTAEVRPGDERRG